MLSRIKGEMAEVQARLDVVLVGVRPVEHHLFAGVGNRVGLRLAVGLARQIPKRDEIALVVIALEEVIEVVIDVCLAIRLGGPGFQRRLRGGVLLTQRRCGVERVERTIEFDRRRAESCYHRLLCRVEVLLELCAVRILERGGNDRGEFVVKIVVDLLRLRVHDPVEAEVQVRLVELKEFPQFREEFLLKFRCRCHVHFSVLKMLPSGTLASHSLTAFAMG